MIHKNRLRARLLAALLAGVITFTSGGFEVLATETDAIEIPDETPGEKDGAEEKADSIPETEEKSDTPQSLLTDSVDNEEGSYQDIIWEIDDEGTLTVTGSGDFSASSISNNRAPWYDYRASIKSAVIKVTGMTNASYMFYDCYNLVTLDVSGFDTSNVTDMSYMFFGCTNMTDPDLSKFNTSNVTNMSYMFYRCSSMTGLNLTNFDTGNVINVQSMFSSCSGLTNLDVSSFNTGNVKNMQTMFVGCSSLVSLNLSNFDLYNVANTEDMLNLCLGLDSIYTPCNVTQSISLPAWSGDVWYAPDGSQITELPKNLSYSIMIAKNRVPDSLGSEYKMQIYAPYNQSQEGQTLNILEPFADYDGITGYEIISYTEDDTIYGNVLSTTPTINNGILNYGTNAGTIDDFATIIIELTCSDRDNITLIINICLKDIKDGIASGSYEGITWKIDNAGKLTVSGTGDFSISRSFSRAPWYDYRNSVKSAVINVTEMTDASFMFYDCIHLESADLSGLYTGNITSMNSMFLGCESLDNLNLSGFNTSNVTDMGGMFSGCISLTNLTLSNFDTGNVTNMGGMFSYCSHLTYLDISNFDTGNVTDMSVMFSDCSYLTYLDISSFDTGNVTNMNVMFSSCSNLAYLNISNFNTENVTSMQAMFNGCNNLLSLNLGNFDTANVTNMEYMFDYCNKLATIYTPYNLTQSVSLPGTSDDVWYSMDGTQVTELPQNLNHSIMLTKNKIPTPLESEQKIQIYAQYNQSQEGQTFNISERFEDYGGIIGYEMTSYTEDDSITGNVLSASPTINNGVLSYGTNAGTIGDFATVIIELICINQDNVTLIINICLRDLENDIAYGSHKGITWMIDRDGKLTLEGRGNYIINRGDRDWNPKWEFDWEGVPWFEYGRSIKSAEVNVTGITDISYMFENCRNMINLDLSGLDTTGVTKMRGTFDGCVSLSSLDVSGFDTSNVTDMSSLFNECSGLSELDISNFDTSKVKNISWMFDFCTELSELDVSHFDTSKVENMSCMFRVCEKLSELDVSNFDTTNVTDMSGMFDGCIELTDLDVSNFDTSNVTNMSSMFTDCKELSSIDVSNFDTSNVTNMGGMFSGCMGLNSIDVSNFDTSNVTNMGEMFWNCWGLTSLDVSNFDTSKVTSMCSMFAYCMGLTSLDVSNFDTSNVIDMGWYFLPGMFEGCSSLTNLDVSNFDTSNVLYMKGLFANCIGLSSLDLSNFDTSNVTDMASMFAYCENLNSLNISSFKTSNVTNMASMFAGIGLTGLDLSHFDTSNVTEMDYMFAYCENLNSLNISSFRTSNVTDMSVMFYECTGLKSLDLSHFDTSSVTDMNNMFYGCTNLESLDLRNFDTSNVTDMERLFADCSELSSLNISSFRTPNVTNMGWMFYNCSGLSSLDVSNFDTSNVTDMFLMFSGCSRLTSLDVSGFDTSKVKNMGWMFNDCSGLSSLDVSNFDTSNVTGMDLMFSGCSGLTSLDVSGFDTSKVKNMADMFRGCSKLTSLDVSSFDTSNVTQMASMFLGCAGLTGLDVSNFNTSKVQDMSSMFDSCEGLTGLNISSFDTSNVTNMNYMFFDCYHLSSLDVSNFDTSKVTQMASMFDFCASLRSLDLSNFDLTNVTWAPSMLPSYGDFSEIYTPRNLSVKVNLPEYGVWYTADGARVTQLPQNLSYSILIKKDKVPTSSNTTTIAAYKTKTVYVCGESLNIDDISVTYYDGTGTGITVTDFTTNADEIDMFVPGKKILKVTYNGLTAEIELRVTFSLTDAQVTATLPEQTFVYSRLPITPEPTVTVNINGTDTTLYEGRDYKLSYQNNVNAGDEAEIIITGQDIYSGTFIQTFTIEKAPLTITASDITLIAGDELPDDSTYEYQVQGICRGDKLIKKPSFTCDVTDMTKTGTYTITPHDADAGSNYEITYYSGTLTVVENGVYHTVIFDMSGHGSNMTRRAIKTGTLLKEPPEPQDPESAGYTFAGWYKDKSFAARQKWNFAVDTVQDDITLYACWLSMAAENGNGTNLCIQEILPQTYTGSPLKPTVLVYDSDGTTLLKSGKDYTISYYNNTESDAIKFGDSQIPAGGSGTLLTNGSVDTSAGFNATLAYVIIKGKGNYTGTVYRNFHIDKALISNNGDTGLGNTSPGITLKYTESLVCNDKKAQRTFTSIKYKKAMTAGKDYTITLSANAGEAYTAKAADGTGIPLNEDWLQSNNGKTLPTIPKGYFGTFKMTIEGIGNYGGTVEKTIFVSADKNHLIKNASITLGKNQKKKANATKEELEQGITLTPAYYDASTKKYYLFDETGEPTGTPMDKPDDVFAIKSGNTSLKYGKDYIISSYVNNHSIGTATMTIQGIGEYIGTKNITFTITGKPFKNITVEGLMDMTFTGKAITQSDITLTNGMNKTDAEYKEFEYGTDYSIAYKNNIKKGTATITFTAKPESGYSGSFKKTFKITAADLNLAATAAAINSGDSLSHEQDAYTFNGTVYYTKNGAMLSDRIRLTGREYSDITLKEGTDYTVSYTSNKAVTTGSGALMTLKGKGNYQGSLTIKFSITAAPISAENKNLTISAGAIYYDGKKGQYVPKIKITDGKKALSAGDNKDYTVTEYINNDKASIEEYLQLLRTGSFVPNSKKPQAVLNGKGNYSGNTTLYFDVYDVKINNNNLYIVISNDLGQLTYSGRQLTPEITVYYSADIRKVKAAKLAGERNESILTSSVNGGYGLTKLTNRIDYTHTWGSNVTAGKNKGIVTITGMGLYGGKVTGKFTILSKDVYTLR